MADVREQRYARVPLLDNARARGVDVAAGVRQVDFLRADAGGQLRAEAVCALIECGFLVVGHEGGKPLPVLAARRALVGDELIHGGAQLRWRLGRDAADGHGRMGVGLALRHEPVVAGGLAQMRRGHQVGWQQVLVRRVQVIMVVVAGLADQEHKARRRRLPVRARVGDEVSNGLRLRHAVAEGIVHLLDVHQADAQAALAAVFDERLQRVGERRGRDDEFVGALVDGTKRVGPRGADLVWFTGSIGRKGQITAIGQWVGERYADGAVVPRERNAAKRLRASGVANIVDAHRLCLEAGHADVRRAGDDVQDVARGYERARIAQADPVQEIDLGLSGFAERAQADGIVARAQAADGRRQHERLAPSPAGLAGRVIVHGDLYGVIAFGGARERNN